MQVDRRGTYSSSPVLYEGMLDQAKRALRMVWKVTDVQAEQALQHLEDIGGHPSRISLLFGEITTQLLLRRQNNLRHGIVRRLWHAQRNLRLMLHTATPLYIDEK